MTAIDLISDQEKTFFDQIEPGAILSYKTLNVAKIESVRTYLLKKGIWVLPFERVMEDASPVIEETESTTDGNCTLKQDSLTTELSGLSVEKRRINMARALGYVTKAGYEVMIQNADAVKNLGEIVKTVTESDGLSKPDYRQHLEQLFSPKQKIYYAIDDTELVFLHPDRVSALPALTNNPDQIIKFVEIAKERDRLQKLVIAQSPETVSQDDLIAMAESIRAAEQSTKLIHIPTADLFDKEKYPDIRVKFSDILPKQGNDMTLINAIISTDNMIINARASHNDGGPAQMVTQINDATLLIKNIDRLMDEPYPGPDAADFYGAIGIDAFLHATHRAIRQQWDQMLATYCTDLRIVEEVADRPTKAYPVIRREESVLLQPMPWNDLMNYVRGTVTSLDDALTLYQQPAISVGQSFRYAPLSNGPLSAREMIFRSLISPATDTEILYHRANNNGLDIALVTQNAANDPSSSAQKAKDTLIAMGHEVSIYQMADLFPEGTAPKKPKADEIVFHDPRYQTLNKFYSGHGVYIVVDPSLEFETPTAVSNLQFGQLVSELLVHSDIGDNDDRGQIVIGITNSEQSATTSHELVTYGTTGAARGYIKNPHYGHTLHVVHNGPVDNSDILEDIINSALKNSMVRLGGRACPEMDFSLPYISPTSDIKPFSQRANTLPVCQIRLFGSASKNNYHYLTRVKTFLDVLYDELTAQGIVADIRHGNGQTSYMGQFSDRFQVIDGLMIPSYGNTTPELLNMEAGGQFRALRNGISRDIRRRTNGVMEKISPTQPTVSILFDGGIGSLAEYYATILEPGKNHILLSMPESTMKDIVIKSCRQAGKPFQDVNLKTPPDITLSEHLRPQIQALIAGMKKRCHKDGFFMTREELCKNLGAITMETLPNLQNWRDKKTAARHNPAMVRLALGN
jgi:hypothetical protein